MTLRYRKPTGTYISSRQAPDLYAAEEALGGQFHHAAKRLADYLGIDHTDPRYWTVAMPQAVYNLLEAFDTGACVTASIAYLENRGFTVTDSGLFFERRDCEMIDEKEA